MKLGTPNIRQNLPPVQEMAIITKETNQISGVETNTKSSLKKLKTTTTGSISLWKSKNKLKSICVYNCNVFYSLTISDNKIIVLKSSSSKLKVVKIIFYINLFICRCWYKLLLDTGAEKSLFSTFFIFCHNSPTFFTKTNHLILADNLKVAVTAETLSIYIRLGNLNCK